MRHCKRRKGKTCYYLKSPERGAARIPYLASERGLLDWVGFEASDGVELKHSILV